MRATLTREATASTQDALLTLAYELVPLGHEGDDLHVSLTIPMERVSTTTQGCAAFDRNVRLVLGSLGNGKRIATSHAVLTAGARGKSYRQGIRFRRTDDDGNTVELDVSLQVSARAIFAAAVLIVAAATGVAIASGGVPPDVIPQVIEELVPFLEGMPEGSTVELPAPDR